MTAKFKGKQRQLLRCEDRPASHPASAARAVAEISARTPGPDRVQIDRRGAAVVGDFFFDVGSLSSNNDTLAEWLRRRPAKPMGSPRVGSNPTGVAWLGQQGQAVRLAWSPREAESLSRALQI